MSFNFLDTIFEDIPGQTSSLKKDSTSGKSVNKPTTTDHKAKKQDPTMIKIHDPFRRAYDCLKGVLQKNHGLNQITRLATDRKRAIQKLKNKHFMLTKNEVKRGKKHPKT